MRPPTLRRRSGAFQFPRRSAAHGCGANGRQRACSPCWQPCPTLRLRCSTRLPSRQSTRQDLRYLRPICYFAPLIISFRSVDYILGQALLATQFFKSPDWLTGVAVHVVRGINTTADGASLKDLRLDLVNTL